MSKKTHRALRRARDEVALINAVILEGMMIGLFESCQVIKPTDLGKKMLKPFSNVLRVIGVADACREVFALGPPRILPQDAFLLRFLKLLEKGKGAFKPLANELDKEANALLVRRIVRYLGMRFATFFCLMALQVLEMASTDNIVSYIGSKLRLAAASRG
jgi:hypothetical protein